VKLDLSRQRCDAWSKPANSPDKGPAWDLAETSAFASLSRRNRHGGLLDCLCSVWVSSHKVLLQMMRCLFSISFSADPFTL
jgi:hypothetical protein